MLRARGWYAEALRRDDAGNPRGARAAIRAGLRLLDEHRAVLGAIDVRAHAAGHRTALAELGLRIALRSGRPRDVLEWAERGRATGLLMQRSGRPPDDPEAAEVLAALRGTVLEINELHGAGRGEEAGPLLARQTALERRIRERSLHRGGPRGPPGAARRRRRAGRGARRRRAARARRRRRHAHRDHAGRRPGAAAPDRPDAGRRRPARPRRVRRLPLAAARPARRAARRGRAPCCATAPPGRTTRCCGGCPSSPAGRWSSCRPGRCRTCRGRCCPRARGGRSRSRPSATLWLGARFRPADPGHALVAAGPALPGADAEARAVAAVHGVDPVLAADATAERVLRCARRRRPRPPGHARPPRSAQPAVLRAHAGRRAAVRLRHRAARRRPRTPSCWPRARAGGPWCARATSCSASARCSWPAGRASSWRPRCPSRTPRPRR